MKKNVEILKDENSILSSYKIDLENKKKAILKELKELNKAKEEQKNKKPDDTKVKDLVLERIHKPDITLIEIKEEELKDQISVPLADKERVITCFRRYDISKKENTTEFVYTPVVENIEIKHETKSIPLAYKDRPITHFKRYDRAIKEVNRFEDDLDLQQVIMPEIKVVEIAPPPIQEISREPKEEAIKVQEYKNEEINDLIPIPPKVNEFPKPPQQQTQDNEEETNLPPVIPTTKKDKQLNVFVATDESLSSIKARKLRC